MEQLKEEKCGQCHYFNSKDGICRNKQMQKECFQGDKDNILYVSREEQKCALFKSKVKDNKDYLKRRSNNVTTKY